MLAEWMAESTPFLDLASLYLSAIRIQSLKHGAAEISPNAKQGTGDYALVSRRLLVNASMLCFLYLFGRTDS